MWRKCLHLLGVNSHTVHLMNWRSAIKYEQTAWTIYETKQTHIEINRNLEFPAWLQNKFTFLNVVRFAEVLPVIIRSTGCCTTIKITGKIRWISIGYKYQLDWSIVAKIWLNELLHCWPTSQILNAIPIARHNWTIDAAIINGLLSSRDWNNIMKQYASIPKLFVEIKTKFKMIQIKQKKSRN